MPNARISELTQHTPTGTEYLEVIITPFVPGTNRKVLFSDIFIIAPTLFRGDWAGSNDAFPTSGGSGAGGVVKAGDEWFVVGAITLDGDVYNDGTIIKARTDTPGQTSSNWRIIG